MPDGLLKAAILPLLTLLVACAPAAAPLSTTGDASASKPAIDRTVVLVARAEVNTLATKALAGNLFGANAAVPPFNASLETRDANGVPIPELAWALPQLNTDSWRIFPDGRMETSYELKPNLTWHDGTPLYAQDFVFAWDVYATPAFGLAGSGALLYMQEVVAPDARTILIRWKNLYPEAGTIGSSALPPLPEHLLQEPFRTSDPVTFVNHPFWIADYVGLGPYKVSRWEPGAFIEGTAFDGFVLGKPHIERVRLAFMADINTIMANVLSGDVHFIVNYAIGLEDAKNLEERWAPTHGGTVAYFPILIRMTAFQLRPELSTQPLQQNVRFREAIFYATDNDTAFEVITYAKGARTVAPMHPDDQFYPAAQKGVINRSYDPQRARQLLEEIGLVRGPDGIYRTTAGEPVSIEWSYILQQSNERENQIFASGLREVGIEVVSRAFTAADVRQPEVTKTHAGLSAVGSYGGRLIDFTTSQIPTAQNRYNGGNTSGWAPPEYERLVDAFLTTIEPAERARQVTAMAQMWSSQIPTFPNYWTPIVNAWPSSLSLVGEMRHVDAPGPLRSMHLWEWKS